MAFDSLLALASTTTVAATATTTTNSTAVQLHKPSANTVINVGGTPRRGLVAHIHVTTCSGTASTVDFAVQHSDDGTSFATIAVPEGKSGSAATASATLTNAAGAVNLFCPFSTRKAYVRLQCVTTGANQNVVYSADITLGLPH